MDGMDSATAIRIGLWITQLFNTKGMDMTIRDIQYDDMLWMLKLRNANAKWFTNTNDIDILEHISWFKDNYRHPKNTWYVAEINHKQAGYIRNDAGVISYCVDASYRNKGIATALLKRVMQEQKTLKAIVHRDNKASIRVLEKQGFKRASGENKFLEYVFIP